MGPCDVSFEVPAGQVLGIVGRNGAGKSTMLKVLSRITEPTEGRARVRGRIASLLEVGTGFHPELTGRENVYLNGAILGMTRAEIAAKFDEIVDFSEAVEQFLDTPVKRHSSGMFLRLAFAVAAFLEPEILVIDEVLAVGDAKFQKKCLGRMREVSRGDGRTVLFVSHNMATVRALCDRCVLLNKGSLVADGDTETVVEQYLDLTMDQASTVYDFSHRTQAWEFGTGAARFTRLELAGVRSSFVNSTADFDLLCTVLARRRRRLPHRRDHQTLDGVPVMPPFGPDHALLRAGETGTFRVKLPNLGLAPGRYACELKLGKGKPPRRPHRVRRH
ncbi:MAG: ABC transporter ATP-binding protein [Phycisphaerales bacterium]